ncbi:MAG: SH3 domain-containing protein [Candidatus Omnitrophica bacterium]|nr:SH3 domain-containing protein [Candidatus Omnitrophota bacterium]
MKITLSATTHVILRLVGPKDLARSFATLRMTGLMLCFFIAPVFAWTVQDTAELQKANQYYRDAKFSEASSIYRKLSGESPHFAGLFYNLGNSLYRQKSLGPAILAYEQARKMDPRNGDIVYNLNYVRSLLEYRIEDKRNWYLKAAERFLEYFTEKEIYLLAMTAYFFLTAGWVFVLFFHPGLPWGTRRKTLAIILLLFATLAVAKYVESRIIRDGVVVAKSAEVRYGPSGEDQIAFRLSEGLKVYVLESRSDWSRILLVNGETGWVSNDQIAEVRV